MNISNYQMCSRCVMDTSAIDISFNEHGHCNYCSKFETDVSHQVFMNVEERLNKRNQLIEKIKLDGRGKKYDCVIGVSGGVDSSWVLYLAIKEGLRPLAVHMDNGWNSELAQNNISNLVRNLGVELYTHVINWNEYRNLMQAFFEADVIDVELLYDNAMLAVNYQQASKYGIKYILSGSNQATEGMSIPRRWNWFKRDKKNIKEIGKKLGKGLKINTFPSIGTFDSLYYQVARGIQWIPFLDNYEYNKSEVLTILQKEMSYKPYPYKHYESVFTRFYQGHILPRKFNVDKRRIHLSTLIMSNQMKREEVLEILNASPYPDEEQLKSDLSYFIKKMKWSQADLDNYLSRPEKRHEIYGTEKPLWDFFKKTYKKLKRKSE